MGCDVHGIWQAKKGGKWVDVESEWEQDRHYFLFSWLAGVRNGYGFAGVPTYAPVKPLSEPRGYPEDFEQDDDMHPVQDKAVLGRRADHVEEGKAPSMWMGDHSHSWLTADEILACPPPGKVWTTGVISIEDFSAWDGHSRPAAWCGGISGKDIRVAESPVEVKEGTTHVHIWWIGSDDALAYFVDEVKRLKELHGEVRLVFGFDS